jgi:(2Fe-2S) ferredoxin
VEEILHEHLLGGRVVGRLRLPSDPPSQERTRG